MDDPGDKPVQFLSVQDGMNRSHHWHTLQVVPGWCGATARGTRAQNRWWQQVNSHSAAGFDGATVVGFLKVRRHGGTVAAQDWTLELVRPGTGGTPAEGQMDRFIPIAGTGYCAVDTGALRGAGGVAAAAATGALRGAPGAPGAPGALRGGAGGVAAAVDTGAAVCFALVCGCLRCLRCVCDVRFPFESRR